MSDTSVISAKATAQSILAETNAAAQAGAHSIAKELAKWYTNAQSLNRIEAMVKLAKSDPRILTKPEDFDHAPEDINVQNGTLDLRTGLLRCHRAEDLLTKLAPVEYHPDAECPLFEAFLERIFSGNSEVKSYVQRLFGYCLVAGNPKNVMFILHGNGANGKSVLVNTVMDILGRDYAMQLNPDSLMEGQGGHGGAARSDLAKLQGVRLVAATETSNGNFLNEALIKQMTGGEPICARFLYANEFEFLPHFTVLLSTNHKPIIQSNGEAIWRRIQLLPFDVTIPETERDHTLATKLKDEKEGIFTWLVEGVQTRIHYAE